MKQLISLAREKAMDIVREHGANEVMFKSGVWNSYAPTDSEVVCKRIQGSKYGADVSVDENGRLFVCCPVSADMW